MKQCLLKSYVAQMQSLEVQKLIRVCADEKETHIHHDKYLLDVFPCFAWCQPFNSVS